VLGVFKKLGLLAILLFLGLPAWCAMGPGMVSGYVRDSSGAPQIGAVVQILGPQMNAAVDAIGAAAQSLRAVTDDHGFYSFAKLLPGTYSVKVTAPSFLPTLREKVGVRAGGRLMVNMTLTSLFEAIQLISIPPQSDQDDWKWTLRSIANRPVLRVLGDGTTAVIQEGSGDDLKGSVAFLAGAPGEGFGTSSDMSTAFSVERSLRSTGTLRVNGNVGYGSDGTTIPVATLRSTYTSRFNNVFEPSFSITAMRMNSPDINNLPGATLQALSLTSSDRVVVGDKLEMSFGSQLQTIQFMGRVRAFKPFGSADLHLSPNTVLEYQYASSVPDMRLEDRSGEGFDPGESDPSATGPRMSIVNFTPAVERAHHQEVSLSQRIGKNSMQVAFYSDSFADPVITGAGELTAESGDVLPDIYSGTFSYQGNDYSSRGMRVVLQRKLLSDLTATVDYSYGSALDLARSDVELQDARDFIRTEHRQAVAAKLAGNVPKTKTHWVASYRYANARDLTPVDTFNCSPGQADPYFNLFVRQRLPSSFLAGHMDLLIDLRNLLAQGYVPVMGRDGRTVYLVQSARSVRGGLAFNF
jgi:Carboxypeptidase regulatory-like domain